jgi:hypothetical protein
VDAEKSAAWRKGPRVFAAGPWIMGQPPAGPGPHGRQAPGDGRPSAAEEIAFAKNPDLLSNANTKGSNSLILLHYKIKHTHSKIASASRHYEVLNFRLAGHAATLHVEPDLRLEPVQV